MLNEWSKGEWQQNVNVDRKERQQYDEHKRIYSEEAAKLYTLVRSPEASIG